MDSVSSDGQIVKLEDGSFWEVDPGDAIDSMYTPGRRADPITRGMHIQPALSEVVESAFYLLMPPAHYHHVLVESLDFGHEGHRR